MSERKLDEAWFEATRDLLPRSILRDRWGNVMLNEAEWDRLNWWQKIRYDMFGRLPASFQRDPM